MEIPLGIVIKGVVIGLDIVYEICDDTLIEFTRRKSEQHSMASTSSLNEKSLKRKNQKILKELGSKELKSIDFPIMKVNKHKVFSFIIRNLSGINTNSQLTINTFNPGSQGGGQSNSSNMYSSLVNTTQHKTSSKSITKLLL